MTTTRNTIYQAFVDAGVPIDSHESDLYVQDGATTRRILRNNPHWEESATRFKNQIDGTIWLDIPFAYEPFWSNKP